MKLESIRLTTGAQNKLPITDISFLYSITWENYGFSRISRSFLFILFYHMNMGGVELSQVSFPWQPVVIFLYSNLVSKLWF